MVKVVPNLFLVVGGGELSEKAIFLGLVFNEGDAHLPTRSLSPRCFTFPLLPLWSQILIPDRWVFWLRREGGEVYVLYRYRTGVLRVWTPVLKPLCYSFSQQRMRSVSIIREGNLVTSTRTCHALRLVWRRHVWGLLNARAYRILLTSG